MPTDCPVGREAHDWEGRPVNLDNIWTTARSWLGEHPTELTVAGIALGLGILAVVLLLVARALRGKDLNAKASIGFGVVQAGVAYITITGVYEFFRVKLTMPSAEAWLLAGFIEACVWAAVGMIYAYGKGKDEKGTPNVGFGPAGPFFWITVGGGGLLAILGSQSGTVAIGRIVVVVLGANMWYLRLLQVTRRSDKRSRFLWTPKRLALRLGIVAPEEKDVDDGVREWQVRQIARAIRWKNSHQPWKWLGARSLVKCAEATKEDVIAEGRRRYAVAYLLSSQVNPETSPLMRDVIASVQRSSEPEQDDVRDTDAELAQARHEHTAELNILRDDLAAQHRTIVELEQAAGARSADDAVAELARVRAQLEQLEQLHQREQAAAAAADREAAAQQHRAEQLETALGEMTAELDKMRRESDQRVSTIADDLLRGSVEPEAVMAQYGGSRRTAQRLIQQARKLNDDRQTADRPRSLTVVNGR